MFENLKIGTRLALGFGVMVLLISVMVFFSFRGLSTMQHATDRLVNGANTKQIAASEALTYMQAVVRSVNSIVVLKDPAEQEKEKEKIQAVRAKYGEAMKRLETLIGQTTIENRKERRSSTG